MKFFILTLLLITFPWQSALARKEKRQRAVYRDVPVYKNKCSYDTYKWEQTSTRTNRGTLQTMKEQPPTWPEVGDLGNMSRAVARPASFKLTFEYTNKKDQLKTVQTDNLTPEAFSKWSPGDKASLTIRRRTGNLVDFEPLAK